MSNSCTGGAQEVLLELCLIMPARLSDLLAVLPRIMAPLVRALKSSPDLVTLALRTLEYWIDRCAGPPLPLWLMFLKAARALGCHPHFCGLPQEWWVAESQHGCDRGDKCPTFSKTRP